ncbi:MAG: creatininase family protein, partial [Boseongicola sp.]|nr:creatininase family protein [Boseongicola sp.]
MTRRLDWADFRTTEFEGLDPDKVIAVLPTAAIEQHGPHLPVGTDTMIAEGMLDELRRQCPDDLDIRILPVQAIGKSNEHLHAAGTLTLTAENALRIWKEIGLSVARAGVRKIAIVNSHGGNLDLISILSRELRVDAGMLAVKCQWGGFGAPEGLFSDRETQFGIHGGDRETSLMLHFRPDTVDMSKAVDFPSTAEEADIPPIGPVSYGCIATDL